MHPVADFNPDVWSEMLRVFKAAGVAELVDVLIADLPEQQRRYAAAVAARDFSSLKRLAHTLRGASMQFGAQDLVVLCASVEAAAVAGTLEPAAKLGADMIERYRALVQRLSQEAKGNDVSS